MSYTSSFTIYTSSDPQGPGVVNGIWGSLLTVLDACLVNGYGTGSFYKAPAGWSKPLSNISGTMGCFKQGTGSLMTLFVNDAAPIPGTAAGKEAWICGYERITSLTGSVGGGGLFTGSYGNGAGDGQFPLPAQSLTYGHVVVRKSTSTDTVPRPWFLVADASTVYMWIMTGDSSTTYYMHWGFGDIYSLKQSGDNWKCMVYGINGENVANSATYDFTDMMSGPRQHDTGNQLQVALPGHYIARGPNGTGASQGFSRKGDSGLADSPQSVTPYVVALNGILQCPSGLDNSIYMSPLWLVSPPEPSLRGQFRGMYHICHGTNNFTDGQIFVGSGDYVGKTFMVVKVTNKNSMWAIEISPTVSTN